MLVLQLLTVVDLVQGNGFCFLGFPCSLYASETETFEQVASHNNSAYMVKFDVKRSQLWTANENNGLLYRYSLVTGQQLGEAISMQVGVAPFDCDFGLNYDVFVCSTATQLNAATVWIFTLGESGAPVRVEQREFEPGSAFWSPYTSLGTTMDDKNRLLVTANGLIGYFVQFDPR
jgi:hypothetical protein